MDVWDEPLHEPGVVTVTLPGVVRQVEAGEAEPVVEAGRQHAGQVAEAARGQVEAAQPTDSVVTNHLVTYSVIFQEPNVINIQSFNAMHIQFPNIFSIWYMVKFYYS